MSLLPFCLSDDICLKAVHSLCQKINSKSPESNNLVKRKPVLIVPREPTNFSMKLLLRSWYFMKSYYNLCS